MPGFADQLRAIETRSQRPTSFSPTAYYNKVGDCVEFIVSSDSYYSVRIDDLVTVYYSYETKEIIGSVIKGVRGLCKQLTSQCPGFAIEIENGRIRLAHLLLARMWSTERLDHVRGRTYKKLVQVAEESKLDAELQEACTP